MLPRAQDAVLILTLASTVGTVYPSWVNRFLLRERVEEVKGKSNVGTESLLRELAESTFATQSLLRDSTVGTQSLLRELVDEMKGKSNVGTESLLRELAKEFAEEVKGYQGVITKRLDNHEQAAQETNDKHDKKLTEIDKTLVRHDKKLKKIDKTLVRVEGALGGVVETLDGVKKTLDLCLHHSNIMVQQRRGG